MRSHASARTQALREHREGKRDELECKFLEHQLPWTSVSDIAARARSSPSLAISRFAAEYSRTGQEAIRVDPELIRPADVVLPSDTQPPQVENQLDAWASIQGKVFEW